MTTLFRFALGGLKSFLGFHRQSVDSHVVSSPLISIPSLVLR
jgi:hypothetical protein